MAPIKKYDIGVLSLTQTLKLLHAEGYTQRETTGHGNYLVLVVPDLEYVPDAVHYKDYGYIMSYFKNEHDASDEVGCLHCGGIYTCAAIFCGDDNITFGEGFVAPNTMLPSGKTPVRDVSDEEINGNENVPQSSLKASQDEEDGGHSIAELSFSDTIELLHKEGYQLNDCHDEGKGDYKILMVHSVEVEDVEYYKEAGYSLFYYESQAELTDNVDDVLGDGIYTCAALYNGETNITDTHSTLLNTFLPSGDTLAAEEDEDEESEDDDVPKKPNKRQRANSSDDDDDDDDDDDYDEEEEDDEDDDDYEDEDD